MYYTEEKVMRIIEPNNKPIEVGINQLQYDSFGSVIGKLNDVTVGRYDVVVVSGSMLPSNRWAQFEYYFQLFQAGVIDQVELLKKTELVDVEGVLARHSEKVQMMQMIEQLQAEVKRLSGDLQTAQRESLHDKKRVEVEKFKTTLHAQSETARKTGELFNELGKRELGMFKERLEMDRALAKAKREKLITAS
jgi:hypothetical protein